MLVRIEALNAEQPFGGSHRLGAHLPCADGLAVNKKRLMRLIRAQGWIVTGNPRWKATRTPMRSQPGPTAPNRWWEMDMTTVMVKPVGWVYLVLVLDWYTKQIVGSSAGLQAKTSRWLAALAMAVQRPFPNGSRDQERHRMSDTGCTPPAVAFMKACATLGPTPAFTRDYTRRRTRRRNGSCARSRKRCVGSVTGPAGHNWSRRSGPGSQVQHAVLAFRTRGSDTVSD
ncbi:MAG: DDE-type integrase/transposase/recombinase [Nitrospirota bacterium]